MASIELATTGRRSGRRRVGFRLDMTPLVDVAFLLLTFFMFATTMSQPQVMEMQVPPVDDPEPTHESATLTFLVREDGRVFHRLGNSEPAPMTVADVERVASEGIRRGGNQLVTVLRADPGANYGTVVAVLDELNAAEARMTDELAARALTRQRRFTIAPMSEADRAAIDAR